MSVTLKQQTVQQRAADATRFLRRTLGIEDLKLLSAIVAEAAAAEVRRNDAFADRIRAVAQELTEIQHNLPTGTGRKRKVAEDVELKPLPGTERIPVDPFAPLDPYLLLRVYGANQLRKALSVYSMAKLKEAAGVVRQHNPASKPQDGRRAESLTDYIVERVAGLDY